MYQTFYTHRETNDKFSFIVYNGRLVRGCTHRAVTKVLQPSPYKQIGNYKNINISKLFVSFATLCVEIRYRPYSLVTESSQLDKINRSAEFCIRVYDSTITETTVDLMGDDRYERPNKGKLCFSSRIGVDKS